MLWASGAGRVPGCLLVRGFTRSVVLAAVTEPSASQRTDGPCGGWAVAGECQQGRETEAGLWQLRCETKAGVKQPRWEVEAGGMQQRGRTEAGAGQPVSGGAVGARQLRGAPRVGLGQSESRGTTLSAEPDRAGSERDSSADALLVVRAAPPSDTVRQVPAPWVDGPTWTEVRQLAAAEQVPSHLEESLVRLVQGARAPETVRRYHQQKSHVLVCIKIGRMYNRGMWNCYWLYVRGALVVHQQHIHKIDVLLMYIGGTPGGSCVILVYITVWGCTLDAQLVYILSASGSNSSGVDVHCADLLYY